MRSPSRTIPVFLLALCGLSHGLGDRGAPEHTIGIDEWKDGWSMLVGTGISRSRYVTENKHVELSGVGPNLATSVGYCDQTSCLELGLLVSFDYYDHLQVHNGADTIELNSWMWETALFLALRARVPGVPQMGWFNPWVKFLSGYGASVGYPQRFITPGFDSLKDRRVQDEGPLFGMSVANIFGQTKPGRIWFVEGTVLLQLHWNSWLIRSGGLLPDVENSYHQAGNPYSILVNLTLGIRAF